MRCVKKKFWILGGVGVVVLCVGVFLHLIFETPCELEHDVSKRKVPIDKIAMSVIQNKDVLLSDNELEGMLAQMLSSECESFSLRSDLDKEKFKLCVRVPFKIKDIFVSVDVLPEISDDNIRLRFSNTNVGRVQVPGSFLLKHMKQNITVSDDAIIIPNTWKASVHGISAQVHVEKIQKVPEGGTNIKFKASMTL